MPLFGCHTINMAVPKLYLPAPVTYGADSCGAPSLSSWRNGRHYLRSDVFALVNIPDFIRLRLDINYNHCNILQLKLKGGRTYRA